MYQKVFSLKFNFYVTVKKGTKLLRDYERSLLRGYRLFLVKIEKMANVLHKKKGDTRVRSEVCTFLNVTYLWNFMVKLVEVITRRSLIF